MAKSDVIEGIKLIYKTGCVNKKDDPSYPWKMYANFRPPEFMIMTFIGMYGGSEEIIVKGKTEQALEKFVELNDLRRHPRLIELEITHEG